MLVSTCCIDKCRLQRHQEESLPDGGVRQHRCQQRHPHRPLHRLQRQAQLPVQAVDEEQEHRLEDLQGMDRRLTPLQDVHATSGRNA